MDNFKGSKTALVADVDCTSGGEALCEQHGVRGYPTIKYGDVSDLKDYNGGRTFADLKKFAEENLGPTCGPDHMDLCPPDKKAKLDKFMAMSVEKIEGKIRNSLSAVEVDVPLMRSALAYVKAKKEL